MSFIMNFNMTITDLQPFPTGYFLGKSAKSPLFSPRRRFSGPSRAKTLPSRRISRYNASMNTTSFLDFYTSTPKFTHEPGLEIMRTLMARLGDPQRRLRCVHIAGTNGKGSSAAMTAAVLQAAGFRTGLFTSPDLVTMAERIRLNGVNITQNDFISVTARVKAACQGLTEPSFFEKITAAAFLYFSEQHCDYVVLETGLGGRLDATNVLESCECAVITPIGLDHTGLLGNTLSAIAGEKAGILKPGRPAICAVQEPEAFAVLQTAAQRTGSDLHSVDINQIRFLSHSPAGQFFSYEDMERIELSLLGRHQVENACTVIETARALGIDEPAIRAGLRAAQWPCRFEYLDSTPPFLLDGAHNAHGAAALATGLTDYFPGQRFTMIMGVLADKDFGDILARMEPLAARFICIAPDSPRALPAQALADRIQTVPAIAADSLEAAIALANSYPDPVCAFGSLYYIGALRALLIDKSP